MIIDGSPRLTPYWRDQELFYQWVKDLFLNRAVTVLRNRGNAPAFMQIKPETKSVGPQLPKPRTLVIALGDLGCLAQGSREDPIDFWIDWGRQLRDNGNPTLAMVPMALARLDRGLRTTWTVESWGGGIARASDAGDDDGPLEAHLTLLAPALRLEHGLLRAIRTILPETRHDPGYESLVWQHRCVVSGHRDGATLAAEFQTQYRPSFAQRPADQQKAVMDLLRRWHAPLGPLS